jgi:hypothetical protein
MLRSVMCVLAAALSLSACSGSSIRSQEGHACSINSSDDPQLVCSPSQDLVCIATYTRLVTNPTEAVKYDGGLRQVFVCRLACASTAECPQPGDVCCPGQIYGKTYNKMGGCVPPSQCEAIGEDQPDAGAVMPAGDAGPKLDLAAPGAEAGTPDGAAPDAPSTPDAAAPDAAADGGTLG